MDVGVPGVSRAVRIGSGAFGVVYRAHEDAFDRAVAVKVLEHVERTPEMLERFRREVLAVGRLSGHPHIVAVHSHGTTASGAPYLVMELCERGSLGDRLRAGRLLPWQEATDVAVAVAGALETSHRAGIVHRDVKPDNLLVDGYGTVKLADFGVARAAAQATMPAAGGLTGSPAHLAPELLAGAEPSPATDVYALASTLHTLVTGRPPFLRDDDPSLLPLLHRITHEPPPDLRAHGVPDVVADVVLQGLAKAPADRPEGCADLAARLNRARRSLGLPAASMRVQGVDELTDDPGDATVVGGGAWPRAAAAGASSAAVGRPAWAAETVGRPAADGVATGTGRARRGLVAAVVAGVLLVTVGAGATAAVLLADDGGDGGGAASTSAGPTDDVSADGAGPSDEVDPAPDPEQTASGPTDAELADQIVLSAAQVGNVTFSDWTEHPSPVEIDPNQGYCDRLVAGAPDPFAQATYFPAADTAATATSYVASAGGVFETADDASSYLARVDATADCGSWTAADGTPFEVSSPPFTPTLLGCRCQEVTLHDVLVAPGSGAGVRLLVARATEDRFLSVVTYEVPESVPQDAYVDAVALLLDLAVYQVNQAAEEAP